MCIMKSLVIFALVAGVFAADNKCPENQHYNECGTLCPVTCENYENPPKVCVLMCNPGCECDDGYVYTHYGACVKPKDCPPPEEKNCDDKPDPGVCRSHYPMWYYDKSSRDCKEFIYGGCVGNGNRYGSRTECLKNCAAKDCGVHSRYNECGTACPLTCENYKNPPKICPAMCEIGCECEKGFIKRSDGECVKPDHCYSPPAALDRPDCDKAPDAGQCRGYFERYYYDEEAGMCKPFIYGGCGGNRNNFNNEWECFNKCGALHAKARNACEEDKEVGTCKGAFARFYFNKETRHCEPFIYGGCGGNSNNFHSQEDCEDVCLY